MLFYYMNERLVVLFINFLPNYKRLFVVSQLYLQLKLTLSSIDVRKDRSISLLSVRENNCFSFHYLVSLPFLCF